MGVKSFRGEGKGKGERGKNEPRYPVDKFCTKSIAGPWLQKVFRFLDPNGSGSISREELRSCVLCFFVLCDLGRTAAPCQKPEVKVCVFVCVFVGGVDRACRFVQGGYNATQRIRALPGTMLGM